MDRPYLVLVDEKLWDRKLTRLGAEKVARELREKGLQATVAYQLGSEYEPMGVK